MSFDRIAPIYNFLTKLVFGRLLFNAQTALLSEIKTANSILVFGGGTGELLPALFAKNPSAKVWYLDQSKKMIEKAKMHRLPNSNITFICGNETAISTQYFDAIITPFVLDCFSNKQLKEVICKLKSHLTDEGKWLFTDFNIPKTTFMRLYASALIKIMYLFFYTFDAISTTSLPDFERAFNENNLALEQELQFQKGLIIARCYRHEKR